MAFSIDVLKNITENRRSVYPKDFNPGMKIADEVIAEILDLAVWAPTHKLTQPWWFKVYRNEGVKQFFNKQAEIYKEITPKELFSQRKLDKYAIKAEQVSHVIAIIARHHQENKIPEIEEIVATACALQNIYLSLSTFNVAGYLSTGNICYTSQMANYLNMAEGDKCLGFFQLGIPVNNLKPIHRKRIPAKEKTEWVG